MEADQRVRHHVRSKRKRHCEECDEKYENKVDRMARNKISNTKTSETKKRQRVEYEERTLGDKVDLTAAAQEEAANRCIAEIKDKVETYQGQYPNGFMLAIYGTSVGSITIVYEGVMQFTNRGYQTPPIVDARKKVIPAGLCCHGL